MPFDKSCHILINIWQPILQSYFFSLKYFLILLYMLHILYPNNTLISELNSQNFIRVLSFPSFHLKAKRTPHELIQKSKIYPISHFSHSIFYISFHCHMDMDHLDKLYFLLLLY